MLYLDCPAVMLFVIGVLGTWDAGNPVPFIPGLLPHFSLLTGALIMLVSGARLLRLLRDKRRLKHALH